MKELVGHIAYCVGFWCTALLVFLGAAVSLLIVLKLIAMAVNFLFGTI